LTVRTGYYFKFPPGRYLPATYLLIGEDSGSVDFAKGHTLKGSVADTGCLSPNPDFYPSRILDPEQHQKRMEKNFIFDEEKNFFKAKTLRIIVCTFFTQKFVTELSKIWDWDPGSEILDPRSGIRIHHKVKLKKKCVYIYVNSTTQRCPKKYLKLF
jgi:hypothetical protein